MTFFQRNRVVFLHVSFWCVYASFLLYQAAFFQRIRGHSLEKGFGLALVQFLFTAVIAYLNYSYALPRFLKHKNIARYLLEFIIPFALLIAARVHLQRFIIDGYTYQEGHFYSSWHIVQISAVTLFIVIFVAMLRFAVDWFELEATKKELENEKLTAELNFLKAQINPHFLFNTLNNLYYLAFTQSPNTTEVIAKLSQMMRYMIHDSNHPKVPLNKEVEYMQNYISLEKLRMNNQIPVQFEVIGNLEDVWIAPFIFITFLENAFKHGVSNNNPEAWVNICIKVADKECIYWVENSKSAPPADTKESKSGIGLRNVKRRLELVYPQRHQLKVLDQGDRYSVHLNLKLA